MNKSIYICHHKPGFFLKGNGFTPLHVGKACSLNDIGCSGDDTGENISLRNPFYCELTAHYWAYKNDLESDYIGLMHYRRHFNFSGKEIPENEWGCIVASVNSEYEKKFGLHEEAVEEFIGDNDVILPEKWDVRKAGSGNNYDHYKNSPDLFISDYEEALAIVREKYPEFSDVINKFNGSPFGYYTNMFVMKREVFFRYSEWLFDVLFELEKRINLGGYNTQQRRVFGHIAERLMGIYFTYEEEKKELKIKLAQRVFCDDGEFNGEIEPAFDKTPPIVICLDDNYAHAAGALLRSIVEKASPSCCYDIVFFESGVSAKNKARLKALAANRENFSIRFFDINVFNEVVSAHVRPPFSPVTYARLFIPKVFSASIDRVVFIDTDTIVADDLALLYAVELGDNYVAAVKDIVMEGFLKFGQVTDEFTGAMSSRKYINEVLEMPDPGAYFQAGLIVFNMDEIRKNGVFDKLMDAFRERRYWFLDQDIMNKVFYGKVTLLPLNWNVFNGNGNSMDFFPALNFSTYFEWLLARENPSMVHFAGGRKPWIDRSVDFSDLYWNALSGTPWMAEMLGTGSFIGRREAVGSSVGSSVSKETRFRSYMKSRLSGVMPSGSLRRQVASKIYLKMLLFYRVVLSKIK